MNSIIKNIRPKKILLILLVVLSSIFASIIGMTIIVFSNENTRTWFVESAVDQANRFSPITIELQTLSSPNLGEWHAQDISVFKNKVLWINLRNLSINWNPIALLHRKISIELVNAETVNIYNLSSDSSDENKANNDNISELNIPDFYLGKASIKQVNLIGIFPEDKQQIFSLQMTLHAENAKSKPFLAALNARTLSATPAEVDLRIQGTHSRKALLEGTLTEPSGGELGTWLKLPRTQHIKTEFALMVSEHNQSYDMGIIKLALDIDEKILVIDGNAAYVPAEKKLTIELIKLHIENTSHSIKGSLVGNKLDFDIALNQFPLDVLSQWNESISDGFVTSKLNLSGPSDNIEVEGTVSAETNFKSEPLKLDFSGKLSTNSISINYFDISVAGVLVTAGGSIDRENNSGKLNISSKEIDFNLLSLADIQLPPQLSGRVATFDAVVEGSLKNYSGKVHFNANGAYKDETFELSNRWTLQNSIINIDKSELRIHEGNLTVEGTVDPVKRSVDIKLFARKITLDLLQLVEVSLPEGLNGTADADIHASGGMFFPAFSGNLNVIGEFRSMPFVLEIAGNHDSSASTLTSLHLSSFEQELLEGQGKFSEGKVTVDLSSKNLPSKLIAALGFQVPEGKFNAEIHSHGPLFDSEIAGSVEYEAVLPLGKSKNLSKNLLNWKLGLTTTNDAFNISSSITRETDQPHLINISIPKKPYTDYFLSKDPDKSLKTLPIESTIVSSMNLRSFSFLLDESLHKIDGSISTNLQLDGTISQPKLTGSIELINARYENVLSGTIVEHIQCKIDAMQTSLKTDVCQASDDHQGKYILTGTVDIPTNNSNGNVDMTLTTDAVNLIRRSNIQSETSGAIKLTGDFSSLLAKGDLQVSPLTASLDNSIFSSIPAIKVEEMESQSNDAPEESKNKITLPKLQFDITLAADQQAYLRGRGLEVELKGKITLQGDLDSTQYEGEFKTVRGVFEIFNKKFNIDQGRVSFVNDIVSMYITGTYEKNDQRIQADLSGSSDDLKLTLSATPYMPEDEILGYIVLGKSLESITPFEAIQLATAVQTLRGGSSFFDPIAKTREALGVDSFSIESTTTTEGETGVNVGVGKYINEKVYLELDHTPDPSHPWVGNIKIELAPNLNLESSTGGANGIQGAELRWKRDY